MGACTGKTQLKNELRSQKHHHDQVSNTGTNAIIIDILNSKGGRITKEYTLLNPPIGKGSTSEVRKAIHRKSGQMRAVKIMANDPKNKESQAKIKMEVEMLQVLDHPNILKIQESYQDDRFYYIVTELCGGGELFHKIEQQKIFSEGEAAKVMKQLLRAIFYAHQIGVVHRDIRPENIMFESEREEAQIRLVDFGSACYLDPGMKLQQPVGQAYYMSPEMYSKKYDEKCDIWACGIVLFILLCGYPPFLGKTDEQIKKKACAGVFQFDGEEWSHVSQEAKDLIRKMLLVDASKRLSAQECLQDAWIERYTQQADVEENQLKRVFQNMVTYNTPVKLQEVTLSMIVFFLASKEEKQELMSIFQSLDVDHDGRLSQDELKAGMAKVMTPDEAEQHSHRIVNSVDRKQQGTLDYSTFLVISIDRQNLLTKNRMETAFKMIDRNGSGGIAVDELKETFRCNLDQDHVWKQIIQEVDRNQDGQISLTEFKEMLLRLTK